MSNKEVIEKLNSLPDNLKKEVIDFIEFLEYKNKVEKDNNEDEKKLKFDWEGGLSELKNKFTSVELQHIINNYR